MFVRPAVTHAVVAAVAVVSSSRRNRNNRSSQAEPLGPYHRWCLNCEASGAEIKRDFFIFQNPHGLQDYAYKGALGDGGFSTVFLSVHKRTGQPRAIKKICREETNSEEFEGELRALISLDHPHIVKILEYFEDPTHFYVVMELCTGLDLFKHITESVKFYEDPKDAEREAAIIIRQCLKAVVGCHSMGFIHRDLKPENFILMGKDLTVKLIDFGLATRCGEGQRMKGIAGTQAYMAPEMFLGSQEYDKAVDIWSLGVILFIMLAQQQLLPDGEEQRLLHDDAYVKQRIWHCDALAGHSESAIDLLDKMLTWDPEKRITAFEVLEHPFITARGCELLCDRSEASRTKQPFDWEFDRHLPSKMERYAKSPHLRQIGLRCLVHLASAATLPDDLVNKLLTARHHFRSLNPTGSGQVFEHQLRARLEQERIPIPGNFSKICRDCQHGRRGPETVLDYDVLVACILIDATWPDALLREVFNILDRSRDGVIEVQDLVALARAERSTGIEAMFREVDPEGKGYINYDKFMGIMEVSQPLFQWFVPSAEETGAGTLSLVRRDWSWRIRQSFGHRRYKSERMCS
mmetsp:Transcript_41962/g.115769  ORF Transcript_41962/g.115769 Transcript_41962/m.115769 type:complete len:577 (+) Transcript_41962:31-1761(+)